MREHGRITVELYRGPEGLMQLSNAWTALVKQLPRPRYYQVFGWWYAYVHNLAPNPDSVYFFLLSDETGPLAIVPVIYAIRGRFGLHWRELSFPVHSHVSLNDILYRADRDAEELLARWRQSLVPEHHLQWDLIRFNRTLEESPLTSRHAFQPRMVYPSSGCDYVCCDMTYEDFQRRFSDNFKAQLRKARNRCKKEIPDGARFVSASEPADVHRYFNEFLRIEASGWKGGSGTGTAVALHPLLRGFYESLIDQYLPARKVRINCLLLGDQAIAGQFCLLEDDTLYSLKIAYDENWSRLSPGHLLLEHVVRTGMEKREYHYVNFVTHYSWQREWRPEKYDVYDVYWFNQTAKGYLMSFAIATKRRLKALYRRARTWQRELAHAHWFQRFTMFWQRAKG